MAVVVEDMNLVKLIDRFRSEDKCRAYLEALRWPEGVVCPRCEGRACPASLTAISGNATRSHAATSSR